MEDEKKFVISSKKYRGETSVISVRLPEEMIVAIDDIARRTGRTRNEIIQKCLEFSLENLELE